MTPVTYTITIEPAPPVLNDDGMKWTAKIEKRGDGFHTTYPRRGYGEFAVEAAAQVVAEYVEDPR